jgi:hypothetical protein
MHRVSRRGRRHAGSEHHTVTCADADVVDEGEVHVPEEAVADDGAAQHTGPLDRRRGRGPVHMRSGNWHGAGGTSNGTGSADEDAEHHAGENAGRIPLGLDRTPMAEIIAGSREIGINSVRLPFSSEMIHDTRPVTDDAVAANPALRGRTPLQVYDTVVRELTACGLVVILDNHTDTTRWYCGVDGNERWNASRPTEAWEDDWLFMARRYRDNERVVGADLCNEVRRDVWDGPDWGLGDDHDWFTASHFVPCEEEDAGLCAKGVTRSREAR